MQLITDFGKKIELTIISLIDADFAAATVMISFGALLGKVSPIQMSVAPGQLELQASRL